MESKVRIYKNLNALAEQDDIVIFGGAEDVNIPIGELRLLSDR